jgi:two-component system chemotaxis sensor kinase CheA
MAEIVDGISEKALGEFLSESQEIVESLNRDVLKLEDDLKRGKKDPELINHIFRAAHSLKGLSGMFGAKKMLDFAHGLENLLDGMRLGRVSPSADVIDALFESVELFNRLIAESSGGPKVPKRSLTSLKKLLDQVLELGTQDSGASPIEQIEIDPTILGVLTEYEEYRLIDNIRQGVALFRVHASFDLMSFDESLARLTAELKSMGEVITTLPSSESSASQGIDFDIIVGTRLDLEQVRERVGGEGIRVDEVPRRGAAKATRPVEPSSSAREPQREAPGWSAPMVPEFEESEDQTEDEDRSEAGPMVDGADTVSLRSVSQTVRVDIKRLDLLMNAVGELVLVRTAIQNLAEQLKAEQGFTGLAVDLYKEARNFERKLNELQSGIMDVRMVPLGQNFEKLSRMVRKLSRSANKEVELRISGADTELDKLIVEDLADPLMHILRNAIDHGIEEPQDRERAGKPRSGTIELSAYQKGNHVVIEIGDDGRGVDLERVKAKARDLGLVEPSHLREMSDRDAVSLLFLPGLSTSTQVSELSGRGVGLDVVKTNIGNLSGMIDVQTQVGQGCTFVITLPITLAIIRALIIRVNERIYAVPLNSVVEIINVRVNRLRTIERREVLELRGSTLPLLRLNELFELGESTNEHEGLMYVVVVGLAENRLGIVVDGMIGQQDIVIKPLGRSLSLVPGIAGATNLANQQTILVLDVGALIEETLSREK